MAECRQNCSAAGKWLPAYNVLGASNLALMCDCYFNKNQHGDHKCSSTKCRASFWKGMDILWGFPGNSGDKESACNAGDPGWIPGSGRSLGEGHGYPLQYSCLESPMDRGAWQATVYRVTKSQIQLSNWHFHLSHNLGLMSVYSTTSSVLKLFCTTSLLRNLQKSLDPLLRKMFLIVY